MKFIRPDSDSVLLCSTQSLSVLVALIAFSFSLQGQDSDRPTVLERRQQIAQLGTAEDIHSAVKHLIGLQLPDAEVSVAVDLHSESESLPQRELSR